MTAHVLRNRCALFIRDVDSPPVTQLTPGAPSRTAPSSVGHPRPGRLRRPLRRQRQCARTRPPATPYEGEAHCEQRSYALPYRCVYGTARVGARPVPSGAQQNPPPRPPEAPRGVPAARSPPGLAPPGCSRSVQARPGRSRARPALPVPERRRPRGVSPEICRHPRRQPLASALRLAAAPRLPAAAPTPLGLPPAHRPLAPEGAPSGPLGAPAARGSLQGTALPCSVPPPPRSRGPRRHLRSSPAPHSPLPGPAARLPAATTACPPPSTQPILSLGANERQPISGQGEEEKTHSDRGARVTGASLPPTEGGAGLPAIAASQEGRKAPPVRQGPAPCGEAPPSRPEAPC